MLAHCHWSLVQKCDHCFFCLRFQVWLRHYPCASGFLPFSCSVRANPGMIRIGDSFHLHLHIHSLTSEPKPCPLAAFSSLRPLNCVISLDRYSLTFNDIQHEPYLVNKRLFSPICAILPIFIFVWWRLMPRCLLRLYRSLYRGYLPHRFIKLQLPTLSSR